jgi:hypothetical protein
MDVLNIIIFISESLFQVQSPLFLKIQCLQKLFYFIHPANTLPQAFLFKNYSVPLSTLLNWPPKNLLINFMQSKFYE